MQIHLTSTEVVPTILNNCVQVTEMKDKESNSINISIYSSISKFMINN